MAFDPTSQPNADRGPDSRGTDARLYELATGNDEVAWRSRSRIILSPMAAPSIMGLFGFAIATMMVGAWQAGWYGTAASPLVLWPFAMVVGGIPQLVAAAYALRARDGVAVAAHTVWGAFWLGWGTLMILVTVHLMPAIALGSTNRAFGFWWIGLCVVTASAGFAALANNWLLVGVLAALAAGCGCTAAGFWSGGLTITNAGGYLFVASAALAWLLATALMLENAFGRTIIPIGTWSKAGNLPGKQPSSPIAFSQGMPGSKVGQ